MAENRDVADGLWLWRQPHPDWSPSAHWQPDVSSFCVTSRGVTAVLDPLAPQDDAVWRRLDGLRPTVAAYLKPDHLRDVRRFHDRYGATVYGELYVQDMKEPGLERFHETAPGMELPGGIRLLDDGRWRQETPAYLPEQRALVFADGLMCDPGGVLRVWYTPWHEQRVLPALRKILEEHDIDHVLVSHGEPVHTRSELENALTRDPWKG
jgi:glyoxylase-like metal-dependent hydrolase (beta-lactamase superfamily II)